MKRVILTPLFVCIFMLAVSAVPVYANCYEVGMQVKNSSSSYVSIPIQVYERYGGERIDNGSLYSMATPDSLGYNFFIDYNDNCSGSGMIRLDVGTEYVIEFHYPGSVKSLCFIRYFCSGTYDTFYRVTPTSFTHLSGDDCDEEYSYPDCNVVQLLLVSLVVYDINYVGDKTIFKLRATATGGDQSYTFSWTNASRTSPTSHTNPNTAIRTILRSQTVTVSVTVTSADQSVTKYKTLYGEQRPW